MIFRSSEGNFDIDAALQNLIEKYEVEDLPTTDESAPKKTKKRKNAYEDDGVDGGEGKSKPKMEKKSIIVANEENRPVAEAIKEMADIYFRNKDTRKGGQ